MNRYINAEEAKRAAMDAVELSRREYEAICKEINAVPTADVVPVVHGKWEYTTFEGSVFCSCSVCGEQPDCFEPKYCPNCGAKMDGGN